MCTLILTEKERVTAIIDTKWLSAFSSWRVRFEDDLSFSECLTNGTQVMVFTEKMSY